MEKNFDFDEVYNTLSLRKDIAEIFQILMEMEEDERRKTARRLTWYFQGKVKVVKEAEKNEIRFDLEAGVATIYVVGHDNAEEIVKGFEAIEERGWLEDPFK